MPKGRGLSAAAFLIGHWALGIGAARGRLRMARAPVGFGSGDGFAKDLYELLAFFVERGDPFRSEQLGNNDEPEPPSGFL